MINIKIDEGTRARLGELKYKIKEKTYSDTIEYLIAYYNYCEAKQK